MGDTELIAEIHELVEAQFDGRASAAQTTRLEQLLAGNEQARKAYLQYVRDSVLLASAASGATPPLQPGHGSPVPPAAAAGAVPPGPPSKHADPPSPPPQLARAVVAAIWPNERWLDFAPVVIVGALMLALGILAGAKWFGPSRASKPPVTASSQPRGGGELGSPHGSELAVDDPFVATLVDSANCLWLGTSAGLRPGSRIVAGMPLRLASGIAELVFHDGARVVLEGPAVLRSDSTAGVTLDSGTLAAEVPPTAYGFSVQTATGRIIDLGTRFAVSVDGAQVTEVHVFDGAVELIARQADGMTPHRERLVAGGARRMPEADPRSWQATPLAADRFAQATERLARAAGPQPHAHSPRQAATWWPADMNGWRSLLVDRFAERDWSAERWELISRRFAPREVPLGWQLPKIAPHDDGGLLFVNGPKLITRESFDPYQVGPIRVRARWIPRQATDTLMVVVRAELSDDPGEANPFRHGVLCQCGWMAVREAQTISIVAGYPEQEQPEFSHDLWGGFEPGQPCELEVIDDGDEVRFRVITSNSSRPVQTLSLKTPVRFSAGLENRVAVGNHEPLPGYDSTAALVELAIEAQQDPRDRAGDVDRPTR